MANILVAGANGQLGSELRVLSQGSAHHFVFVDLPELDITEADAVKAFVRDNQIGFIINCAAYTNVDKAEGDAALARKINGRGARVLGEAARENDAVLLHISTDYVYDGTSCTPYEESDATHPMSVYGESKLEGEGLIKNTGCKAVIIRTSWLYSSFGNNFVKTMRRLGAERGAVAKGGTGGGLGVIYDQIGTPTYARDLAGVILSMVGSDALKRHYGQVYHYSNEGVTSWYDFALSVMELSGIDCEVRPIRTSQYPTAASRPGYSVLDKSKIKKDFDVLVPHWRESLKECVGLL